MAIFFQQIINALAIGGIYALMSVGYALIYSLLMFTNFAHSVAVTFGSYAMYLAMTRLTSNFYLGMFAGVIAGAAVALIIEITSYKPLLIKNSARSSLTIIGLGISTIGTNAIILVFSSRFKVIPTDFGGKSVHILDAYVSAIDIVIVLICLAMLFGVQMIINKTRLGLAIRAASHDLDSASLMGVNVQQLLTIVFVLAGAMAGIMTATKYQAYPALAANMTNKSFIAAVVGGLGSLEGAVIGSFVLAMGEVMISGYVSSELRDLFSYGLLIAILLIRPRGIMGKRFDDKA
jgi:branched-chain amino acid transport system permease protein